MNFKKNFAGKLMILVTIFSLLLTPLSAVATETEVVIEDPTPDSLGPVLNSLTVSANEATPEKTVKLTLEATDDLSGIDYIRAYYKKPSGNSYYVYFNLNQMTGKYEGNVKIDTYDEAGDWMLYYIVLFDKKDNSTTVIDINDNSNNQNKIDLSPYKIKVSGVTEQTDKTPPTINSVNISSQQIKPGETIKITADVIDELSGIRNVDVRYISPSNKRTKHVSLYFNETIGKYEGSLIIDQYDELGEWKFAYIYANDKFSNTKYVYNSAIDNNADLNNEIRDFSSNHITVSETTPDLISPVLEALAISLEQASNNGAVVKLTAQLSDELSGISYFSAHYQKPSGKSADIRFGLNSVTGKYEARLPIDKYDELGLYSLRYLYFYDYKSNYTTVYDSNYNTYYAVNKQNFEKFHFTVRGVITVPPPGPFSLTFPEKMLKLEKGQSYQLKTILNMTDATTKDVTPVDSGTTYTSSNPAALQIDEHGLITVSPSAEPGVVRVEAENSTFTAQIKIVIPGSESELKEYISVNPLKISLSPGKTKQLNVIASLTTGDTDVTLGSTGTVYSSSNPAVATVNENGLITLAEAAREGENVSITINHKGLETKSLVTVMGPPTVKDLAMTPGIANVTVTQTKGETVQLSVAAGMSDGTSKDVTEGTSGTVYTTSDSKKATVDSNGLVTIPANTHSGKVTITAVNNNIEIKSIVEITGPPTLENIELESPLPTELAQDGSIQIPRLKANWSDGTQTDVTSGSTYESSNTSRMTVSETGLIQPVKGASGGAYIYVKHAGKTLSTIVTLKAPPTLEGIELENPLSTELVQNGSLQISGLKANWSDGTQTDVTSGITYESSNTSRMTVSSTGLIEPVQGASGGAYIYVKYGGKTLSTIVTLKAPPTLVGLELESPIPVELAQNGSIQISGLKANWSDGTQTDVTSGIMYESSNTSRMTVSETGLIQPVKGASGGAYIYVKHAGKTLSTIVTLKAPPTLTGIELENPLPTELAQDGSIQIPALKANWSDGTQTDVTSGITYESSNTSRMTVSSTGLIEPVQGASGSSYIYVKYGGKTISTIMTLETPPPTIVSIELESQLPTELAQDGSIQIPGLKANWSNGTQTDVTSGITYESSNTSRMTVSETGLIKPVQGASGGAYIYVKHGGKTLATIVTLKVPPTLAGLELESPIPAELAQNSSIQISELKANWSDGTQTDVTSGITYESSNTSRMTVSSTGLIEPVQGASGGAYIYVKYGGKTLSTLVTLKAPVTLASIKLSESIPTSIAQGSSYQIKDVIAVWADGTETNVTSGVTYQSSNTNRITVSDTGLIAPISGAAVGAGSYIYVKYGGKTITHLMRVSS